MGTSLDYYEAWINRLVLLVFLFLCKQYQMEYKYNQEKDMRWHLNDPQSW